MDSLIYNIEKEYLKDVISKFSVGDLVKVSIKVVEGDKERLQAFEGRVIARKNGGLRETFTVRRVSLGVGIERVFLLHSPRIDKIEVIKRGKVRRAKLYYLRNLSGNAAKIKEIKDVRTTKKTKAVAESKAKTNVKTTANKTVGTPNVKDAKVKK